MPKHDRSRRNRRLRVLSREKRHTFYSEFLGSVRSVLWESGERDGRICGFTDNYIRVERDIDHGLIGSIEDTRLTEIADTGNVLTDSPEFVSII